MRTPSRLSSSLISRFWDMKRGRDWPSYSSWPVLRVTTGAMEFMGFTTIMKANGSERAPSVSTTSNSSWKILSVSESREGGLYAILSSIKSLW